MDTPEVALRRKKLIQWVALNGTPQAEKSLFSQLKASGSFGEKVARRLEEKYKMGYRYLDTEDAPPVSNKPISGGELARVLSLTIDTPEEFEHLAVYRLANDDERKAIDRLISVVRGRLNADPQ
jgi:hypothetical protein